MPATAPASQEALILDDNGAAYLEIWKAGVELAGPGLFNAAAAHHIERATHWHQLTPDMAKIRKAIPNRSQADAAFLAVMASMFNDTEGEKMLSKSGTTLGKLPLILGRKQHGIVVALLTHHKGW